MAGCGPRCPRLGGGAGPWAASEGGRPDRPDITVVRSLSKRFPRDRGLNRSPRCDHQVYAVTRHGTRDQDEGMPWRAWSRTLADRGRACRGEVRSARDVFRQDDMDHRRIRDPGQGQHRLGVGNEDALAPRAAGRMSPPPNRDAFALTCSLHGCRCRAVTGGCPGRAVAKGSSTGPLFDPRQVPRCRLVVDDAGETIDRPAPVGPHGRTVHRILRGCPRPWDRFSLAEVLGKGPGLAALIQAEARPGRENPLRQVGEEVWLAPRHAQRGTPLPLAA